MWHSLQKVENVFLKKKKIQCPKLLLLMKCFTVLSNNLEYSSLDDENI